MIDGPDTKRSPGRPRDEETHDAILAATRHLLLEVGYQGLTFEAVATAASTSRSTVYRWWSSRGALVLEAAAEHIDIGAVPDTGDSRKDVEIAVRQLIETFSDRLAGIVMLAVPPSGTGGLLPVDDEPLQLPLPPMKSSASS